MKANSEDRRDERLSRWFAAAEGDAVPPDEAVLQRLREQSMEVFLNASAADVGPPRSGRSWIMNTRNWKWLIPAAAAAAILVAVGFWPSSTREGKVYGMSDVPALLRAARTLHMAGRLFVPPYSMPGMKQTEAPWEIWLDGPGGGLRQTNTSYSVDMDGFKITRGEIVSDGEYRMIVNHGERTASYERLNEFRRRLQSRTNLDELYRNVLGRLEQTAGFTRTGSEELAGQVYDVWEGSIEEPQIGMTMRTKWWLAPQTGQIGRMQMTVKGPVGEEWVPAVYLDTIERDVVPPPGTFDTSPPAGYTLQNTKERATVSELQVEPGGVVGSIAYTGHIAFQLPDGSLILGWSSVDREENRPQDELFSGLAVGGALPKLPLEVHALDRAIQGTDVTYHGRHLAYTRTGNKYHEWSVYVANRKVGDGALTSGYYRVRQRYHVEERRITGTLIMNVSQPLYVDDAAGFNMFVRGAMAELSDGGVVPEHVTYENVLRLIERIRASLTKNEEEGKDEG